MLLFIKKYISQNRHNLEAILYMEEIHITELYSRVVKEYGINLNCKTLFNN
jgi:hypothetical protein